MLVLPSPSGVYGVLSGINRDTVRSPAICVKIVFRSEVGRAPAVQVLLVSLKNVDALEAICCIVAHGLMDGEVSVEHPDACAP
jgi:hypothetical protein